MSDTEQEVVGSGSTAAAPSVWSCLGSSVGRSWGLGLGLAAGSVAIMAALWIEPAATSPAEILLVLGAALASVCLALMLASRHAPVPAPAAAPVTAQHDPEHLSDLSWQAREGEAHYRDLLDAQADLIARRDAAGNITFVNRSFCRTFAVEAAGVLGTRFEPTRIASDHGSGSGRSGGPCTELVETAEGPRWIAWTRRDLGPSGGSACSWQVVGRDVTEERRAAMAVAAARDEAVSATEAKSRFLARMSHEIRTPMGGVLGMAGLLRQTGLSEEQATHVGVIEQTARELLKLVNEILDLAKVEAGRLDVDRRPMPPSACVRGVVELLAPQAYDKGLELAWSIDGNIPETIESDEARCRQILLNLVGNAIKFTSAGGVRVALRAPAPDALAIEVHDTGPGIADEARDRLFSEFEQHAAATTERIGGTGLGLAISRHLARALGGDIVVATRPGEGSVFTLTLPIVPAVRRTAAGSRVRPAARAPRVLVAVDRRIESAAVAETLAGAGITAVPVGTASAAAVIAESAGTDASLAALIVEARIGIETASSLLSAARGAAGSAPARGIVIVDTGERDKLQAFRAAGFDAYLVRPVRPHALLTYVAPPIPGRPESEESTEASPQPERRPAPYRVLLVEDNAVGALLGMRMLESVGAAPVLARSGEAAVDAASAATTGPARGGFDIVLMDIHLPGIDGIEAARRIKAHFAAEGRSPPPIVALTASAYADDRRRCLGGGLDGFMIKPFEREELEALLETWCGGRQIGSRQGALDEFAA